MKIKVFYNCKWYFRLNPFLWGMAGQTICPYIFFREGKEKVSDRLFRHELEHIYQTLEEGYVGYYSKYVWYAIRGFFKYFSLKKSYINNPFEVRAYAKQYIPLTPEEQKLKDNS